MIAVDLQLCYSLCVLRRMLFSSGSKPKIFFPVICLMCYPLGTIIPNFKKFWKRWNGWFSNTLSLWQDSEWNLTHMSNRPFLIPSILILIVSIPLVIGWIPRNKFYGVRTRKTLSDDRVWYSANRFGGWLFIISSLIYLGIAAFVPYSTDSTSLYWWGHIIGLLLPLSISIFMIHSYTKWL